ncbi:MAG TPA: metallophosphoesterase [Candidatus Acidoferrales bacterium]|nr:metallophosphoesterase [Candidatus Acidoferrales bacterium]
MKITNRLTLACAVLPFCLFVLNLAYAQSRRAEKPWRSEQEAVLVGAGDIADCRDLAGAEATAKLLEQIPGTVFAAGDLAYPDGTKENFECYDRTWGRVKARTRPAPGNHEFHSAGATYYFQYFGAAAGDPTRGYYSYDLATWHIISLNSECEAIGGCGPGSAEEKWLRGDLAAHPVACTLAYFHKPLFSSGGAHGDDPEVRALWQALYEANADVVISGHDHDYERFAPQTPDGVADPKRGIREFVVGTGGKNHRPFGAPHANSEVRDATAFGVLALTLRPRGYNWRFVTEPGKTFADSGSGSCH